MKITQEMVKEYFSYNHDTGSLTWLKDSGSNWCKGKVAGTKAGDYLRVSFKGKRFYVHRLVYLFHHGYLPDTVDHINGNGSDNRIENLRGCTQAENNLNSKIPKSNTSGVKGVSWNKQHNRYKGIVQYKGKQYFIGYFDNLEEASKNVASKRQELHGLFHRHS